MRIHISCYSVFLREWLSVFHNDHFLVLRTEDYHADMKATLQRTYTFLGVRNLTGEEEAKVESQYKKHETVLKKKAGPMFPETRALLEEFFAPFNEDLAQLLGDDRFLWKDR
ncbi:sulfotransferase [Plakobranchus ocellatus]|uniref:Sulfotransferase n=1 Tax=Plakobranchus ocellatus TaxID=259542 RepID=A0AAV4CJB3_9GAST|nr:sulfotransferase [Plakobranchus ocellatus]